MTPEELRDGIFALNTRRFGTVAEIMVKKLKGLGEAQFHITEKTLQTHLDRFLIQTLTYSELLKLLQ